VSGALEKIQFAILGGGGAILRAERAHPYGVSELLDVAVSNLVREHEAGAGPLDQHVVDEGVGVAGDELFGDRRRSCEERPDPEAGRESPVRALERVAGRNDVDDDQGSDAGGVVGGQAVCATGSSAVAGHGEPGVAERVHHLELVDREAPHRVVGGGRVRSAALPMPTKIGRDDREAPGKSHRHLTPHDVRLRHAVEEEQRWPSAADDAVDDTRRRFDIEFAEPISEAFYVRRSAPLVGPMSRGSSSPG
jgi:hypothetical protein